MISNILLVGGSLNILILWDFDGVIVITPHEKAWRMAAELYGITGFTSEFYHKYVSGRPRYEGARAILERFGKLNGLGEEEANRVVREFGDLKNTIFNELISRNEYEVNTEVLEFIKETRHYTGARFMHILASASRNVSKLSKTITYEGKPISSLFDYDVSGLGNTKKEVFEKGMKLVNEFSCAFVVDDAPAGIVSARELGLIPLGFRNKDLSRYGAVMVIESFRSLRPEVIHELCLYR